MDEVHLHVTDMDGFFRDAMAMAERLDRGERTASPARIGFESMETFLKAITPNRWVLLSRLKEAGPSSIRALAARLGRDYRGVHADVTALLDLGLIARNEAGRITVPWSRITAELSFEDAA